jgi:hypothetical protein
MSGNRVVSWGIVTLDALKTWQAYENGTLSGWHISDLAVGVTAALRTNPYTMGLTQSYKFAKNGAPFMTKATMATQEAFYRDFSNRMWFGRFNPFKR